MIMRRLHPLQIIFLIALLGGIIASAFGEGCRTAAVMQRMIAARKAGLSLRTTYLSLPSRTMYTSHFAIHYTMGRNVHRPRLTAVDSAGILHLADSIYAQATGNATLKDQAINAGLDSLNAPDPVFVQKAGVYFERAYAYDSAMGFTMPHGGGSDQYYAVPADTAAIPRFIVDIGDISTLDPVDGGATYGLTFPPLQGPYASILLENDFLYNAVLNTNTGKVTGTPITTASGSFDTHNYYVDWEMGIKVTASHEFYHAVQYVYTPSPDVFHAWYELSAVGMEERLAPEIDDYLQYLPSVLLHHETVSLLTPPESNENYGNATFHQYLTYRFGNNFDVKVWTTLKNNGDDLPSALTSMITSYGARWDSVYASYTSALATAGRAGSASTCADSTSPIFLRDLHCWPQPSFDTLPALNSSSTLNVPALTFRLLKPSSGSKSGIITLSGSVTPHLIMGSGSNFNAVSVTTSNFVQPPSPDGSALFANFSSTSFAQSGQFGINARVLNFSAIPDPATVNSGSIYFSAPVGIAAPQTLTIVSESGREVANLSMNADNVSWTWNLKDLQNHAVQPGAYCYRIPGIQAKTLLILPH